ncbi:MAG: hypothetical protein IJ966_02930 [Bacilli bacterium]|nr:hypothetical protein [Bacilli bacterium]
MVNSISYQAILLDGQSANSTKTNFGPFVKDTIEVRTGQNVKILSITAQLDSNLGGKMEFTYSTYATYRGA